jgi:hypothetical protein
MRRESPRTIEVDSDMVTLHVPPTRTSLDIEVEERLQDLVVAYSVEVTDAAAAPVELPAVFDSGRWVAAPELSTYIGELGHTVALWRKFQSDACYIDDDGSVC